MEELGVFTNDWVKSTIECSPFKRPALSLSKNIGETAPIPARFIPVGSCRFLPAKFKEVCSGSRARAYAMTGDYLAEEPFCSYVQEGPRSQTCENGTVVRVGLSLRYTKFSPCDLGH